MSLEKGKRLSDHCPVRFSTIKCLKGIAMLRLILGFFDVLKALKNDNTTKPAFKNWRLAPVQLEKLETREVPAGLSFSSGQLVIDMRDMGTSRIQVGSVNGLLQINGAISSIDKGVRGTLAVNKVTKIVVQGTNGADLIDLSGVATSSGFRALDNMVEIYGNKGNDKIYGSGFGDKIHGNSGNDTIWAGAGNDFLYGDSDDDTLYGESGNDTLEGSDGNDKLFGGADNDKLHGQAGIDYFDGGTNGFALNQQDWCL